MHFPGCSSPNARLRLTLLAGADRSSGAGGGLRLRQMRDVAQHPTLESDPLVPNLRLNRIEHGVVIGVVQVESWFSLPARGYFNDDKFGLVALLGWFGDDVYVDV